MRLLLLCALALGCSAFAPLPSKQQLRPTGRAAAASSIQAREPAPGCDRTRVREGMVSGAATLRRELVCSPLRCAALRRCCGCATSRGRRPTMRTASPFRTSTTRTGSTPTCRRRSSSHQSSTAPSSSRRVCTRHDCLYGRLLTVARAPHRAGGHLDHPHHPQARPRRDGGQVRRRSRKVLRSGFHGFHSLRLRESPLAAASLRAPVFSSFL